MKNLAEMPRIKKILVIIIAIPIFAISAYFVLIHLENRNAQLIKNHRWFLVNYKKKGEGEIANDFSLGKHTMDFGIGPTIFNCDTTDAIGFTIVQCDKQPAISRTYQCSEFGGELWYFCGTCKFKGDSLIFYELCIKLMVFTPNRCNSIDEQLLSSEINKSKSFNLHLSNKNNDLFLVSEDSTVFKFQKEIQFLHENLEKTERHSK